MEISDNCTLCLNDLETTLHVLGSCPKLHSVWREAELPQNLWPNELFPCFISWLDALVNAGTNEWRETLFICLYLIWMERNGLKFNNTSLKLNCVWIRSHAQWTDFHSTTAS